MKRVGEVDLAFLHLVLKVPHGVDLRGPDVTLHPPLLTPGILDPARPVIVVEKLRDLVLRVDLHVQGGVRGPGGVRVVHLHLKIRSVDVNRQETHYYGNIVTVRASIH